MNIFKKNKTQEQDELMKEWIEGICRGPIFDLIKLNQEYDVLEIGSGSGDFTFCLANYLEKGHVYACDINEKNIHVMTEKMINLDHDNITISNCKEGDIRLPKDVDVAIAFLTANKVYDLRKMLSNLKDNIKSGGSIVIIDWDKSQHALAPSLSSQVDKNTISRVMMQEDLRPTVSHLKEDGLYVINGIKS